MKVIDLINQAAQEMSWWPRNGHHYLFVPARMNRIYGDLGRHYTDNEIFELPSRHHYVLYTLNQLSPATLGLSESSNALADWIDLETLMNRNNITAMVFAGQRLLPLSTMYLRITKRNEMLLAVAANKNTDLLRAGELRFKVFSNAWIIENPLAFDPPIEQTSVYLASVPDANGILTKWAGAASTERLGFHNGYLVDVLDPSTFIPGDTLSMIHDRTIINQITRRIDDLHVYDGPEDSANARLVFPLPMATRLRPVPVHEIDVFITADVNYRGKDQTIGILYDRFSTQDLAQFTHQDISLSAWRVAELSEQLEREFGAQDMSIRVILRRTAQSNLGEPRVPGNYINTLYRLGQADRDTVTFGTRSFLALWQPIALETSGIWRWTQQPSITLEDITLLQGLYSYEELCRRCSEGWRPSERYVEGDDSNPPRYQLPALADAGGRVLPYDADGLMMGSFTVPENSADLSIALPVGAVKARFIPGSCTRDGSEWDRDIEAIHGSDTLGERFYYATPDTNGWQVAELGNHYSIDLPTGQVSWMDDHMTQVERMRRAVRDSAYGAFTVEAELLTTPLPILDVLPPTSLELSHTEVYLNGHFLVAGIDYTLTYPNVLIHNRSYYEGVDVNEQLSIEIFHYGLPDIQGKVYDKGFIRNRRMVDGTVSLALDMGQIGFVDGKLTDVEAFDCLEVTGQYADDALREGGLYCRMSVVPAISPWLMALFDCKDSYYQQVNDTVKPLLYEPYDDSQHVFIPYAHGVFSPAFYNVVQGIRQGDIDVGTAGISRATVTAKLVDYLSEIENDIANRDLTWDILDVYATPHNESIELTEQQYKFLEKLNEYYFSNRFNLNHFFYL